MDKELRTATVRELENWPGVSFTEEDGGKHTKAILHFKDQTRMIVVAKTPSDVRAVPNHLALLRREIRALGAERAHITSSPKPKEPPANPVLREVPKLEKAPMSSEVKLDAIFKAIGDLRYSEMLTLAEFLRDVSTEMNMQRGRPDSWAKMLQGAVDAMAVHKHELKQREAA